MKGESLYRIQDEATYWVARMDAGHWTDAEEAALRDWLATDPRRQGALLKAQAAWMTLDKPSSVAIGSKIRDEDEVISAIPRRALLACGSAALAASLVGGLLWIGSASTSFTTQIGEIRRVPLADGSVATINTSSKVKVRLAEKRREVRLDQGEAWFQVAIDAKRPFVVEAGRVRVRAVGTAFAVRRYDDGAEILVTEGVVEAWADGAEGNRVQLGEGQCAFVADNAAIKREVAPRCSTDRALAWRGGKIDLVNEPLSGAIKEFNRYNQRQLVLGDPGLAPEQFDGVFRIDDPEGFAIAVRSTLEVPVDLSNPAEIRIGKIDKRL